MSWSPAKPGLVEEGQLEREDAVTASSRQGGSWGEHTPNPLSYFPIFSKAMGQRSLGVIHMGSSPRTHNRAEKGGTNVFKGGGLAYGENQYKTISRICYKMGPKTKGQE